MGAYKFNGANAHTETLTQHAAAVPVVSVKMHSFLLLLLLLILWSQLTRRLLPSSLLAVRTCPVVARPSVAACSLVVSLVVACPLFFAGVGVTGLASRAAAPLVLAFGWHHHFATGGIFLWASIGLKPLIAQEEAFLLSPGRGREVGTVIGVKRQVDDEGPGHVEQGVIGEDPAESLHVGGPPSPSPSPAPLGGRGVVPAEEDDVSGQNGVQVDREPEVGQSGELSGLDDGNVAQLLPVPVAPGKQLVAADDARLLPRLLE